MKASRVEKVHIKQIRNITDTALVLLSSQSGHLPSDKCAVTGGSKRKKNKRSLNILQALTIKIIFYYFLKFILTSK
jgi:hypothetical protein